MRVLFADIVRALFRKKQPIVFGDLNRLQPASRYFGRERGTPIDRYYIEAFLRDRRALIRGSAMEVADDVYLEKFGDGVEHVHILHADAGNPKATLVGDLAQVAELPSAVADCFVCTQTFMFIYDFHQAIAGTYKLLKPGGTLLATIAGCSQISLDDQKDWGDFFRFTEESAQRMFGDVFGADKVQIQVYGNLIAATALLQGVAVEDLPDPTLLDKADHQYPVIIGIQATRSQTG